MAGEVQLKRDRKVNIATILVGITCMSCIAICALVTGIITFNLTASLFIKIMGVLSIIRSIAKFVEMGVFVKKISRRKTTHT